jgi:hypothetical protein
MVLGHAVVHHYRFRLGLRVGEIVHGVEEFRTVFQTDFHPRLQTFGGLSTILPIKLGCPVLFRSGRLSSPTWDWGMQSAAYAGQRG